MATKELAHPLVEEGVAAPPSRGARWPLFVTVAAVAFAACIAVFWTTSGHAVARAFFTEPSSLVHTNEMLQKLPSTMDQAELYKVHISPYLAIMYTQFLKHFGSFGQRLQGNSSAVAAAEEPSASGSDFNRRLVFFGESVKHIIRLNAEFSQQTGHPLFALTQFADWSPEELESIFSGEMIKEPQAPPATFNTTRSPIVLIGKKCADTGVSCRSWKEQGLCAGKYHSYMKQHCPFSCENPGCARWKKRGFCSSKSKWSHWMNQHCPCHCGDVAETKSMNWAVKYPAVFEVRQQGKCGSCWAHSTVELVRQIDGIKHVGKSLGLLSVQYLVDCVYPTKKCAKGVQGCCGGSAYEALNWISAHGGLPLQASYGKYDSGFHPKKWHKCRHAPSIVTTSGARALQSEAEMTRVMVNEGPISLGVFVNQAWLSYAGGVMPPKACASHSPPTNHVVQCVGYDHAKKAWIVMNSWGTGWGVSAKKPYRHIPSHSGYILLKYGHNTCNLLTIPAIAQNVRRSHSFSSEFTEDFLEGPPPADGTESHNFV